MTETEKLVAAIFAAGICVGKPVGPSEYLDMYDQFTHLLRKRAEKEAQDRRRQSNERMTSS